MPNFTLPKNLRYGNYRARLKVDWANIDPAGQWTEGGKENQIEANGGYVVDFILNVHPETSKLDIRTTNGSIVGKSNKGLPTEVPYGRALNTLLVPAADGYKPGKLTVRHGHNLDGAQYIHGNRQWSEYTVDDAKVHIVKADSVNGEVRMTVDFEPTAEADYKLVMLMSSIRLTAACPIQNTGAARRWDTALRGNALWRKLRRDSSKRVTWKMVNS